MPDEYTCKSLGHYWDFLPGPPVGREYNQDRSVYHLWARCTNCDSVKKTVITSRTGYVLNTYYYPSERYKRISGITKQDLRVDRGKRFARWRAIR